MVYQSYHLVMRAGPTPNKSFPIQKNEIFIGRDIANDILINDAEVSRRHARLSVQAGNYVIEDLGSTNGTFVNGQRLVGPRVLRPGDMLLLGENVSFAFEMAPYEPGGAAVGPAAVPPREPTPVAPPAPAYTPPVSQPAYQPPPEPVYQPPPQPAYQAPPPPVYQPPPEPIYAEETQTGRRTWLWAACGCLVVILCVMVAGAVAFDQLNLYCTSPFRDLTLILGGVCP